MPEKAGFLKGNERWYLGVGLFDPHEIAAIVYQSWYDVWENHQF